MEDIGNGPIRSGLASDNGSTITGSLNWCPMVCELVPMVSQQVSHQVHGQVLVFIERELRNVLEKSGSVRVVTRSSRAHGPQQHYMNASHTRKLLGNGAEGGVFNQSRQEPKP